MRRPEARLAILAATFIATAMLLGGGGSPNPTSELLLELAAVCAVAAWVWLADALPPPPRSAILFAGLMLVVPLLQLVPLPPILWTSLGWQQDRLDALGLVGAQATWQPWSLSPSRTVAGLLSLGPPIVALVMTASLTQKGRDVVIRSVAAMALAGALLGAIQLSLGPAGPRLYAESHPNLVGFQANRNAEADVLLIGLVAAAATFAPLMSRNRAPDRRVGPRAAAFAMAGLAAMLVLATVLTASRMGITLIPVALLAAWFILYPAVSLPSRWRWAPAALLAVVAAGIGVVAVADGNTALGGVAERFAVTDDARRELWRDGWFAVEQSWPAGIGLGAVQPALIAAERLEVLDLSTPNRVHNDYLEFLLEGGILAVAVFVAGAALLGRAALRAWRNGAADRPQVGLGSAILVLVALHSFVDYPLRSMALACLAGTGAGLLFASSKRAPEGAPMDRAPA